MSRALTKSIRLERVRKGVAAAHVAEILGRREERPGRRPVESWRVIVGRENAGFDRPGDAGHAQAERVTARDRGRHGTAPFGRVRCSQR